METNSLTSTHLDIGLSKEDQDRIAQLRKDSNKRRTGLRDLLVGINEFLLNSTRIKLQEKVTFYQLLAVMINAGVPIIRSLKVLSEQNHNKHFQRVIAGLAQHMEEGESLSEAMRQYEKIFSETERGMIASGEASGNLNSILRDIAKQSLKTSMIIAKVKGAMIYPTTIIFIMIVAVVLMLTLVVPKITALFAEGNTELPLTTKILIGASETAQKYWNLLGLGGVILVIGLVLFHRSQRGRYTIHMLALKLPIFGSLLRQLMIARFTRSLSSLILSGIPIVKALEINANAMGNEVYKRRIKFAAQDVAQGIPLGENLTGNEFLFPPMVSSMVLVGERTANLSEVCTKIADYYENEVDTLVNSLSKLMEPVILVVMGLVVGFIVAAIMQPIMALSDISSVI